MITKAKAIEDFLVSTRRHLHQYPELSHQEWETAKFIEGELQKLGITPKRIADTGVIAEIGEGKLTVALRADTDALPIQDEKSVSYASRHPGVMHACGHDAHTAILLGVARLLTEEKLPGKIRFIFQPAEESGGKEGIGGAEKIVKAGGMKGVQAIFGLHINSKLELGVVNIVEGPFTATSSEWEIKIKGKGAHGAYPHEGKDPIYLSALEIMALQGIISRFKDPMEPAVITVGEIKGGSKSNIIPKEVILKGTIRSLTEEGLEFLREEIQNTLKMLEPLGGVGIFSSEPGYPPTVNDAKLTELVKEVAIGVVGKEKILSKLFGLGAEDFGMLARECKGAFFSLGAKPDGTSPPPPHHSPYFDINEKALPIGVAILSSVAMKALEVL